MTNLFTGQIQFQGEIDDYGSVMLLGRGQESLERFRIIIQRDRIRSAARAQLFRGASEDRIAVFLNKQVAYAGHVSFSAPEGESPLGPIHLTITAVSPASVIEWITGGTTSNRKDREPP